MNKFPLRIFLLFVLTLCVGSADAYSEYVEGDKDIRRYVDSDDIEHYDPMNDYLEHLPRWDGKDLSALLKKHFSGYKEDDTSFQKIGGILSRPDYKFESKRSSHGMLYFVKLKV